MSDEIEREEKKARIQAETKASQAKAATDTLAAAETKAVEARATAEAFAAAGKAAEAKTAAKAQIAAEAKVAEAKVVADAKTAEAEAADKAYAAAKAKVAELKAAHAPGEEEPKGLCVYFFDGDTGQPLHPAASMVQFRVGRGAWTQPVALTSIKGRYYIAKDAWYGLLKDLGVGPGNPVEAQMRAETPDINCTRYVSTPVTVLLGGEESPCCCVPVPLSSLEETCTFTVRAYDCSFDDFIEKAEAFLDNVEVVVTSIPTPAPAHAPKSTQRAQTFTAKTEDGTARIAELPLHTLYRVEIHAEGYISETPALLHRYVCCERIVEIYVLFRPCGKDPARSIVFVREECAGIRWANAEVEVGGTVLPTDANGVLHLPGDLTGIVEIKYPGKAFSPSSLNLSDSGQIVHTVAVADHDTLSKSFGKAKRRFRFVDQNEEPFRSRPVKVTKGDQTRIVVTDNDGYFEAEEGSLAHAEAHPEMGPGTEPFLLSSTE
jgi:hypothetical protein